MITTKIKPKTRRGLGWRRDRPDHRDRKYHLAYPTRAASALPADIDLEEFLPPVYDQRNLSACTAWSTKEAIETTWIKNKQIWEPISALGVYFLVRAYEGDILDDAGAEIRDVMLVVNAQGAGPERLWPYDDNTETQPPKFTIEPPTEWYQAATKAFVVNYYRVNQDERSLKSCLASGWPVVFGFTCFSAFDSDEIAKTGVLNLPKGNESNLGGHAVLLKGYKDGYFRVRNSWGGDWGQKGNFDLANEYVLNPDLASDFWTIRATYDTTQPVKS